EDVVEVGGHEEPAPLPSPEHALVVGDVQAASLLGADPAGRREDLDRVADHGTAGAQPGGQFLLGGHPVAGTQEELADQLQDLLGHQLVTRPVGAGAAGPGVVRRRRRLRSVADQGNTVHNSYLPSSPGTRTAAPSAGPYRVYLYVTS